MSVNMSANMTVSVNINFDPKLLKLDKKSSNNITIYYNGYVTKI